jgi:hypothetical protein
MKTFLRLFIINSADTVSDSHRLEVDIKEIEAFFFTSSFDSSSEMFQEFSIGLLAEPVEINFSNKIYLAKIPNDILEVISQNIVYNVKYQLISPVNLGIKRNCIYPTILVRSVYPTNERKKQILNLLPQNNKILNGNERFQSNYFEEINWIIENQIVKSEACKIFEITEKEYKEIKDLIIYLLIQSVQLSSTRLNLEIITKLKADHQKISKFQKLIFNGGLFVDANILENFALYPTKIDLEIKQVIFNNYFLLQMENRLMILDESVFSTKNTKLQNNNIDFLKKLVSDQEFQLPIKEILPTTLKASTTSILLSSEKFLRTKQDLISSKQKAIEQTIDQLVPNRIQLNLPRSFFEVINSELLVDLADSIVDVSEIHLDPTLEKSVVKTIQILTKQLPKVRMVDEGYWITNIITSAKILSVWKGEDYVSIQTIQKIISILVTLDRDLLEIDSLIYFLKIGHLSGNELIRFHPILITEEHKQLREGVKELIKRILIMHIQNNLPEQWKKLLIYEDGMTFDEIAEIFYQVIDFNVLFDQHNKLLFSINLDYYDKLREYFIANRTSIIRDLTKEETIQVNNGIMFYG